MAKYIGKLVNIGYGVESSRGTAIAAAHRQPKMVLTYQDNFEPIIDANSIGNIVDAASADIGKKWSEGTIEGRVYINAVGYLLKALLGDVSSVASGGAYIHTYSLLNSNTHQSLTLNLNDPNDDLAFPLAMIDSMTLSINNAGELTFSVNFMGKPGEAATHSVSYSTDYGLLGKHGVIKLATNLAGLTGASTMNIKSLDMTFTKNIEVDYEVGEVAPSEIFNTIFGVEGTIVALMDSTAEYKDIAFGDTPKAFRLTVEDTATTIGSSENPKLEIDLAKVKLIDWTPNRANDEIVKQTVQFKSFYSMADAQAISVELTNTTTSY